MKLTTLLVEVSAMTSIVFFKTEQLERIVEFYQGTFGASIWLEQPDCTILQIDNQLLGFCERDSTNTEGIITIVEPSREGVDSIYETLRDRAVSAPDENETYDIYHAYFTDPDGRHLEVQTFLHETDPVTW